MPIRPWREQLNNSAMLFFHLLPRVLLVPLDPPWSILWRFQAARRILVHRVIVSLILTPHWARRPAIVVRRILVISPESSSHVHKVVLVFTRVRRCVHLPLVAPPNAHRESLRLLSHSSSIYREICWAYVRRGTFLLPWYNFIDGPMRLGSQWVLALWKSGLPSIQRSFGGLISGQCIQPMIFCNLGK